MLVIKPGFCQTVHHFHRVLLALVGQLLMRPPEGVAGGPVAMWSPVLLCLLIHRTPFVVHVTFPTWFAGWGGHQDIPVSIWGKGLWRCHGRSQREVILVTQVGLDSSDSVPIRDREEADRGETTCGPGRDEIHVAVAQAASLNQRK